MLNNGIVVEAGGCSRIRSQDALDAWFRSWQHHHHGVFILFSSWAMRLCEYFLYFTYPVYRRSDDDVVE